MLEIKSLSHNYGENNILHNIVSTITPGQFVALVGHSGCGKSTLFKTILGTLRPSKGEVLVNNLKVKGPNRNVGIVFQQYTLDSSLTVEQNVALGLKLDQTNIPFRIFKHFKWRELRKKHIEQSHEVLKRVRLAEEQFKKYPADLSGGQKQRVAIAQALIMKPSVILLDEPFGALDESNRESAQRMLQRMYQENIEAKKNNQIPPHTLLIVTHELNEAIIVSDRVIGLSRYWNDGLENGKKAGATIVYDKTAPTYHPDDPKELYNLIHQKEEIREVVLSGKDKDPKEFVTFWDDVKNGEGTGINSPELNDA